MSSTVCRRVKIVTSTTFVPTYRASNFNVIMMYLRLTPFSTRTGRFLQAFEFAEFSQTTASSEGRFCRPQIRHQPR